MPPNPAVSDFFTLAEGGGGLPDAQMPSMKSIADSAMKPLSGVLSKPDLPFVQPLKGTVDQVLGGGDDFDIAAEVAENVDQESNFNMY